MRSWFLTFYINSIALAGPVTDESSSSTYGSSNCTASWRDIVDNDVDVALNASPPQPFSGAMLANTDVDGHHPKQPAVTQHAVDAVDAQHPDTAGPTIAGSSYTLDNHLDTSARPSATSSTYSSPGTPHDHRQPYSPTPPATPLDICMADNTTQDILNEAVSDYFRESRDNSIAEPARAPQRQDSATSTSSSMPTSFHDLDDLGIHVYQHLGIMEDLGSGLIAQMLAQELHRWSRIYQGTIYFENFHFLAQVAADYRDDFMEIGVVLPPQDGRWLANIMHNARTLAEHPDRQDSDITSLMGGSTHRSRNNVRRDDRDLQRDGPRRERPRSRSRRTRVRHPSQPPPHDARGQLQRRSDSCHSPTAGDPEQNPRYTGSSSSWTACPDSSTSHRTSGTYREATSSIASRTRPSQRPEPGPLLDVNEMPLRNGALSLNRLTWRSMLNMGQDPPGTMRTRMMAAPLDSDQLGNILQTTANMPAEDKLALMAGFARFVVEMVQQVFQSVMQNQIHPRVDCTEEEDLDTTMMMQSDMHVHRQSQLRTQFTLLQGALELQPEQTVNRADAIRRRLEERYQGYLQWEHWNGDIQEGHAMLVGICDQSGPGLMEPANDEDREFVTQWWRKLLPLLQNLDRLHYMLEGTHLAPALEGPEPPVLLDDTPVNDTNITLDLEDTRDQYDAELRLDEAEAERQANDYVTTRDRSDAKTWDDWAMADEMGKSSKKPRRRLILELQSLQPGSSSSSTSISVPLPDPPQHVAVSLRLSVANNNTDAEDDGVGLVQTRQGFWEGPLPPLLRALPDQLRLRVLDLLRRRVRVRWSGVQTLLQQEPAPDAIPAVMAPDDLEQVASYMVEILDPLLCDNDLEVGGPESYTDMDLLTMAHPHLPVQGVAGAEGANVDYNADFVENRLDDFLMELGVPYRFQGQRHIVATLVQLIQGHIAQLRVALALLSRRIPQPRVRDEDLAISSTTATELRRLLHALLLQLRPAPPSWPLTDPIDFDAVIPHCGPASSLAISIMQFLENGLYDIHDDISEADSMPAGDGETTSAQESTTNDQMLPPHAPPGPRISSVAMSSSANPLLSPRALQPARTTCELPLPLPTRGGHVHPPDPHSGIANVTLTASTTSADSPLPVQALVPDHGGVPPPHPPIHLRDNRATDAGSEAPKKKARRTTITTTLEGQTKLKFGDS